MCSLFGSLYEVGSILCRYVNQGKTVLQPHQLLAEFESAVVKDAKTLKGGEFEDILKATQVSFFIFLSLLFF